MPDTLAGWGVKDQQGRWLPVFPQVNRAQAQAEAAEFLHGRCSGDPGCPSGRSLAGAYFQDERQLEGFARRLRALGYRVVRVELREVPR